MKEAYNSVMMKNFLHVGDQVIHKGNTVIVQSITLIEDTVLDGTSVPAVPWMAASLFTATLDNGQWAYGEQLKPNRKGIICTQN
jgi:hypothetical protein